MKVNVEIDCTPIEARQFFGLPDVQPMQTAVGERADTVGGQEEIPSAVSAVITARDVDVLSHLAIRARNAGVLLASCLDERQVERLKALEGRPVTLTIGASGDVLVHEGLSGDAPAPRAGASIRLDVPDYTNIKGGLGVFGSLVKASQDYPVK